MRFEPEIPTAEQVRRHREAHGSGVVEAKVHLERLATGEALAALMRDGTAEEKVDWHLRRYAQEHHLPLPDLTDRADPDPRAAPEGP
ncbi:hypothetical protein [Paracoccus sp. ME4]|uniref:hypothetical protein n=1 Tax=Paracoccus sp. ME4 TaxID=3138066 RepID=UPI00398AB534